MAVETTMTDVIETLARRHRRRQRLRVPAIGRKLDRVFGADGIARRLVPRSTRKHLDSWIAGVRSTFEVRVSADRPEIERGWVTIVSHDLAQSGAPRIAAQLAALFADSGYGVVLVSPADGPFSATLVESGVTVILESGAFDRHSRTLAALASKSEFAFCNTVITVGAMQAMRSLTPTFWYLHEVSLVEHLIGLGRLSPADFALPYELWCGSEQSATVVRPWRPDVRVVPYGLEPWPDVDKNLVSPGSSPNVSIGIFGSLESRKGQDLAIEALQMLPPAVVARIELTLYGRTLIPTFEHALQAAGRGLPVRFGGELSPVAYRAALMTTDIVLVPSRDDTLPLVSIDALRAGRILACTSTTGTSAYLFDGVDGFVALEPSAPSIAQMLLQIFARVDEWKAIGLRGVEAFERHFSKSSFDRIVLDRVAAARIAGAGTGANRSA